SPEEVAQAAAGRQSLQFSAFDLPDNDVRPVRHAGAHAGRSFAEERADPNVNIFDVAVTHAADLRQSKRVLLAGWSEGSLDRLSQILEEHGLGGTRRVDSLSGLARLAPQ